ncbi:hypothetical protein CMI37_38870 [Candidatus Pacearchaeota archaeon]|nr:hypothetical protein [Candidatus Pacearchaeota archaeon]|tara:strand:- start:1290 stop:1994 length:705 start_codon:yes stop_codon:yes gene_type:complete
MKNRDMLVIGAIGLVAYFFMKPSTKAKANAGLSGSFPGLNLALPDINFPDMAFPDISFPDISFPDISFPDIAFPDISFPDIPIKFPEIPSSATDWGDWMPDWMTDGGGGAGDGRETPKNGSEKYDQAALDEIRLREEEFMTSPQRESERPGLHKTIFGYPRPLMPWETPHGEGFYSPVDIEFKTRNIWDSGFLITPRSTEDEVTSKYPEYATDMEKLSENAPWLLSDTELAEYG